jgi:DNA-directed RNA polymerase specialized sigma24 family protein
MEIYEPPNDDLGWKEIIIKLTAFAEDQVTWYTWFRGKNALPMGYTAEDFVQETILRYLANPAKYNPAKGGFLKYLKYSILRRLVYNLSTLAENELSTDLFGLDGTDEDGVSKYENYLPVEVLDTEGINFDELMNKIIEQIDGKTILENIFEGLYMHDLKRSEICKKYNLSETEYNNGVRRLGTILKAAILLVK